MKEHCKEAVFSGYLGRNWTLGSPLRSLFLLYRPASALFSVPYLLTITLTITFLFYMTFSTHSAIRSGCGRACALAMGARGGLALQIVD